MANKLFRELLSKVPQDTRKFVEMSVCIANSIVDCLKEKNISQREFAAMLNKEESEISKWLSGTHNFTLKTIAKIEAVLDIKIVQSDKEMVSRINRNWQSVISYALDMSGKQIVEPSWSFTLNELFYSSLLQYSTIGSSGDLNPKATVYVESEKDIFSGDVDSESYMSIIDPNLYRKTG